ncbi:hypothetical protein PTSG_01077 [Salpingoeca rosetta]|uniref:C2 domain-containing protein n=1 Tax=Salpingoeca rosetta (strain ATCC 50818 / BSB-021) TaxID=946362 RepID=F2TYB7_SALR5|nr:uncharacterized protein PTSG_01077 [Salpingoeca rosetta]EGD76376.1 hypothetical protein PTSG_01077 [Salpingoeca rosetta]|eukprot:XP_004998551.1 hypothetical protein PTSG_01077 [Salpingoeca rosetta]
MEEGRDAFRSLKTKVSNRWKNVANAVKKHTQDEDQESRRVALGDRFFGAFHSLTKRHNLDKETSDILQHIPQPEDERLMLEEEQATRGDHDADEVYLSLLQSILHGTLVDAASKPAMLESAQRIFQLSPTDHAELVRQAKHAVRPSDLKHEVVLERLRIAATDTLPSITPKHDIFCVLELVDDRKTRKKGDARPTMRSDVLLQTQRMSVADGEVVWPETFSCHAPTLKSTNIQIELWADVDHADAFDRDSVRTSRPTTTTTTTSDGGGDAMSEDGDSAVGTSVSSSVHRGRRPGNPFEAEPIQEEDEEEDEEEGEEGEGSVFGDGDEGNPFGTFSQLNPTGAHEPTVGDMHALEKRKKKKKAKRLHRAVLKRLRRVRKAVGSAASAVRSSGTNLSSSLSASMPNLTSSPSSSSSSPSTAEGPVLIGRGFVPLATLTRDSEHVAAPLFLHGKDVGCTVELMALTAPADLGSTLQAARQRHGHLIQKVLFHCVRQFQREVEEHSAAADVRPWDGFMDEAVLSLLKQHSDWCALNVIESRLDHFCTLMELHAHYPVSIFYIQQKLSRITSRPLRSLDKADMARFMASLQAVFSYSFPVVSSPFHFNPDSQNDRARLSAHVEALNCVFDVPEWQQALAQTTTPQLQHHVSLKHSPFLDEVQQYLLTHDRVTYLKVKHMLITKFGEAAFLEHKGQVQSMLLSMYQLSSQSKPKSGEHTPLSERLPQLLKQCPYKELTYQKVKDKLLEEYPPAVVDSARKCISVALVHELNERREHAGDAKAAHTTLTAELQDSIAHAARERYVLLKMQARPKELTETSDLDHYALVAALLLKNLEICNSLADCFQGAQDLNLVAIVAKSFDGSLCQDLQVMLATRREELNQKHEVPIKFFELYFELHNLHEFLDSTLSEGTLHSLNISRFWTWFQPFVIEWLYLSKVNCKEMISRSLDLDTWTPINEDKGELFSTSVIDCYRILFDILSFWASIDWPDVEAAEEYLFAHLSETICFCVRFYAEEMTKRVLERAEPSQGQDVLAYTIPDIVFTGLNNLCFASEKLREVYECMDVDNVQQSHMNRAKIANQGHAGRLKPHKSVRHFTDTGDFIDSCMRQIAQGVARVMHVRIKNDVRSIAQKYATHDEEGDGFIDRLLFGLLGSPAERAPSPSADRSGAESTDRSLATRLRRRQSRMRSASVVSAVIHTNPSFLYNNFDLMMVKLQNTTSIDALLEEVWRSVMVLLRKVFLNEIQTPLRADPTKLMRFVLALRRSFKAFFAGGGEGLSDQTMEDISDEEFNTVLSYNKMSGEDLVDTFFKLASELQSDPIATAIAHQRDANARFVGTQNYRPQTNIGDIRFELAYVKPTDTLTLTVKGLLMHVPQQNTYLNVRLLPSFDGPPFKARSAVRKEGWTGAYSETFEIPNITSGRAVQVRVQVRSLIKLDKVLGEVLLDTRALGRLASRPVRISMPLFGLVYAGKPGWIQQCIANVAEGERTPEVKMFLAKYQQRSDLSSSTNSDC